MRTPRRFTATLAISFSLLCGLVAACARDRVHGLDADAAAPATLDFGEVQAGQRRTLPLAVANTGVLLLVVNGAQTASPFAIAAASAAIEQGSEGSLQITFSPQMPGDFAAPLTLTLSSLRTPAITVQLIGRAVAAPVAQPTPASLAVTPAQLTFSAQVPVDPISQTLTLANDGDLGLSWQSASDGPELSLSATSGSLTAHGSAQVSVSLHVPASAADVVRHLTFTAKAASPVAPVVVPVALHYTQPALPPAVLLVEPAALAFSATLPGAPAAQTFRIHNTGGSALHFALNLPDSVAVAPLLGVVQAGAFVEVAVAILSVPALPISFARTVTVATLEAGHQDVALEVAFRAPGPPPPPPQYGGSVWPKFHQGNSCTGLSSVVTQTKGHLRFAARFGPARQGDNDGTYVGSPSLAEDGTIYQVGGDGFDGTVTAFGPQHGETRWSTPINSPASISPSIEATPTVVKDGSIFVMTGAESAGTHFYKLNPAGSILWSDENERYGDGFDSSPALGADGTLYLAYDDAPGVLFFSQGDALVKPHEIARVGLSGRSATQSDLESQSGAIADDGTAYWAANGLLWAMNRDGLRWSHDATDGEFLWVRSRSAPLLTPAGKIVFVYANTDFSSGDAGAVTTTVTQIDAASRHRDWQRKLGPTLPVVTVGPGSKETLADRVGLSSPALGPDGTLYVGHLDGLYALNPADGSVRWHAGKAAVASSPAVGADGTVFFGAMDGTLSAVTASGAPGWSIQTSGQVNSSPAIGADGAVFVASDDGFLYGVE